MASIIDTCLDRCKYCYANKNPQKAFENYKYHDMASTLLLGAVRPEDTAMQGAQKSFLKGQREYTAGSSVYCPPCRILP